MIEQETVVLGERVLRIAAISDIHRNNEDIRFPQREQLITEFAAAEAAGADMLLLLGDLGNRGSAEGVLEVGQDAKSNFRRRVIAVGGNHDNPEALTSLQEMGIDVLDRERRNIQVNGLRIGMYGQNGSLRYGLRERIRSWSWKRQEPLHHSYTRREYHPYVVEQINALVEEGIDVLLVLSHVPLYKEQIADNPPDSLSEMTLETAAFIDSLPVPLKIVLSGHTHSFNNRQYGRDKPITITENNTVVGNIAAPNAWRSGRSGITLLDIFRMPDGNLSVTTAPLLSTMDIAKRV